MVYAFYKGQPVDGFTGSHPESVLRTFIEKLKKLSGGGDKKAPITNDQAQKLLEKADETFWSGAAQDALGLYGGVLEQDPDNADALAGLALGLLALGDAEGAREALASAPKNAAPVQKVNFFLEKNASAKDLPAEESLLQKLEKNPKDHAARFDLAKILLGKVRAEEAIDHLVSITRLDRDWNDQQARKLMIEVFDALGPKNPVAAAGRRKLSSVLFS
jgi:putative thioredoxin